MKNLTEVMGTASKHQYAANQLLIHMKIALNDYSSLTLIRLGFYGHVYTVCRFSTVAARALGHLHSHTLFAWLQINREIKINNRLLPDWCLQKLVIGNKLELIFCQSLFGKSDYQNLKKLTASVCNLTIRRKNLGCNLFSRFLLTNTSKMPQLKPNFKLEVCNMLRNNTLAGVAKT